MTEEQINGVWIRSGLSLDLQDQAVHEFARAIIAQARAELIAEMEAKPAAWIDGTCRLRGSPPVATGEIPKSWIPLARIPNKERT